MELFEEALTATTCTLCHNYLSVPPILAISEDGSQYKCGRCNQVETKTLMRILCFENMAKFLTFPCSYRRCKEKIPWDQVEHHEKSCRYRTFPCPMFYQGCGEIVEASELWTHFTQYHCRNVRYDNISTSLKVNEFVVYLLVIKTQQYLVYICVNDREPSYVSVFSIVPAAIDTCYNLELTSISSGASIRYSNQSVVPYDERRHCLKCSEKECYRKYHPFSMVYNKPGESTDIRITNLKIGSVIDVLEQPDSITFTINVENDTGSVIRRVRGQQMQ